VKKIFALFFVLLFMPHAMFGMTEIRDTEIESVLYELVNPLAQAAGMDEGRLHIRIIGDDDFNAFVAGGEDVFVNTGLIARVESPHAFQAVIAHEMGHMVGGHIAQMSVRMAAEMKRSLIVQALGIALVAANPMAGMGVVAGAGGMSRQSLLAFSRDEERMADALGIDLMLKAGLDPEGFLLVIKQMNDMMSAMESRANPNNARHPFTDERIKNAREKIAGASYDKKAATTSRKKLVNEYAMIRAKIIGYLSPSATVIAIYPQKDTSNPALYARAIAAMRIGNLESAKTGTLTLIKRLPENPFFYELLGDIEYQSGRYDDSIAAYEKSLELLRPICNRFCNMAQIQTAIGLALIERNKPGDADRSVEAAKRALLESRLPLAFWVLSRAENVRGNAGVADWAMAEYYAVTRQDKKSREFARRAQRKLPKDSPEYIKAGDLLK